MLDLQREPRLVTIRTASFPFLQEVFSRLVASERPLLILLSLDAGGFKHLHVEAHELLADAAHWRVATQASHPGQDVAQPTLQRGWQPPFGSSPILETGLAIPGLARPPSSARSSTLLQILLDLLSAMGELGRKDHLTRSIIDQGHPRGPASWIQLEA
jgi:hypothetical protein